LPVELDNVRPIGDPGALARDVAEAFQAAGEELYLVGGAVRADLLGQPDDNLDFATSARPDKTVRILSDLGIGQPYRIGEKFGTIVVNRDGWILDVTTYRAQEKYREGSRKPTVQFGDHLLEDLARRDFTINAMARNPLTGELIDPLGGREDLAVGLIRAVGRAEDRFREDPLRLLRAIRFATRLSFDIEPGTWRAIQTEAVRLATISPERIRDEHSQILESGAPGRGLTLLRDGGLMAHSVPELLELTRMPDHGPRHPLSLWDHTMRVLEAVPPELTLRWAAILHDVAKPATRTHEPSGRPRFFHHEEVGAATARRVLTRLRYPGQLVDTVVSLVETHMQLHSYNAEWSDGAVRRLMLRLGTHLEQAIQLARADAAGHAVDGSSENAVRLDHLQTRVERLAEDGVETLKSPLTGNDLMDRYGRPPGPWIQRVKDALLEEVVEGRLAPDDRHAAWRLADELVAFEV
jgi:poly(A) polymerase